MPTLPADLKATLQAIHDAHRALRDGAVASYIPELATVDPEPFGIAVCTADGQVYEVGDARTAFTLQSISKPFIYGQALDTHGRDQVALRVGVEPTGDSFHAIISLDEASKRPHNPMVNAGAIAMTGMIPGADASARLHALLATFGRYLGRPVTLDMAVYTSERLTGHRNRAIAHLMRNFGMLGDGVEEILDLYFQQCSVLVDARDLAVMAATLAAGGRQPRTGVQAIAPEHVRDVLSVMFTCGMYDYAGTWAFEVGIPAKSGVGGGLMAVVPGRLGIGIFSPRLNAQGHSVRGLAAARELSERWGLHAFAAPGEA